MCGTIVGVYDGVLHCVVAHRGRGRGGGGGAAGGGVVR